MKYINIEVEIFTRMVTGVGPRILSHSPQDYIRFKITLSSKKLELTLWKVPPTSARCRHDGREKQRTWKGRKRGGKQWKWKKMRKKKSKKNNIWRKEKKKKKQKNETLFIFPNWQSLATAPTGCSPSSAHSHQHVNESTQSQSQAEGNYCLNLP